MDNQAYCRKYTKTSKSNFYYSFLLLPNQKRKAIYSVYAFSRFIDDIVDEGKDKDSMTRELSLVRKQLDKAYDGQPDGPIFEALSEAAQNYQIPKTYFEDLIGGVEMDIHKKRYDNFEELEKYCYHVASVVGLICIEIFGYTKPQTKEYAINMGKALQLTNILRDLKVDGQKGRIYLPHEELEEFGYSEDDLLKGLLNESFKSLMKFQLARAEGFYKKAFELLPPEDEPSMFAGQIMGKIYHKLLEKIIAYDYDVFNKQIEISTAKKLFTAINTFAKCKLSSKRQRP